MIHKLFIIIVFVFISVMTSAAIENTNRGKIAFTEGHLTPDCRTVHFIENDSGISKRFRIESIENSDINSVILTALATQNDVQIWFDENITSGCGTEPRIYYIRLYRN